MKLYAQRTSLLTLLTLFSTAVVVRAEGVVFFQGTWDEAVEQAARQHKYIMVDAYTDWCGWCKVQDRETFTNSDVAAVVNEHFIPIKVDFEKGIGVDLAMKFRVNSYPTILFFNPEGQLVHSRSGYTDNNQKFIDDCNKALAVKEERPFAFDSRDFDIPFPEFYRVSFRTGENRSWPEQEDVVAYLDSQDDLFSEVNWSVLWRFGGGDKYEDFVLKNREKYGELYGSNAVSETVYGIFQNKVYRASRDSDEAAMHRAVALVDTYLDEEYEPEELKLHMQQYFYQRTEEWEKYAGASNALIELDPTDASAINSISWTLYEKSDDQDVLNRAVAWMKPVVEQHADNWMFVDTYAALLFKTGNLNEAAKYARRAIERGDELGEDVSSTRELLERIRKATTGM